MNWFYGLRFEALLFDVPSIWFYTILCDLRLFKTDLTHHLLSIPCLFPVLLFLGIAWNWPSKYFGAKSESVVFELREPQIWRVYLNLQCSRPDSFVMSCCFQHSNFLCSPSTKYSNLKLKVHPKICWQTVGCCHTAGTGFSVRAKSLADCPQFWR